MTFPEGSPTGALDFLQVGEQVIFRGLRREPEGGGLEVGRRELGGIAFGLPGLEAAVQQPHLAEGKAVMGQNPPQARVVAMVRIDDDIIMAAHAQPAQKFFHLAGRGRQAGDRLAAVLGIRPPHLNGAGDVAQVISRPGGGNR